MEILEIIARPAMLNDVAQIAEINGYWYTKYREGDMSNGVNTTLFAAEQLASLIKNREVVVAEHNGQVVGYYLSNSLFENEKTASRKIEIEKLIQQGVLEKGTYVYQMNAGIKKEYRGYGLSKKMLTLLKTMIADRIDYMSGVAIAAVVEQHKKAGWKFYTEMPLGPLAVMSTK